MELANQDEAVDHPNASLQTNNRIDFSTSASVSIRAGINLHLTGSHYLVAWQTSRDLLSSILVLTILVALKRQGKDLSAHSDSVRQNNHKKQCRKYLKSTTTANKQCELEPHI